MKYLLISLIIISLFSCKKDGFVPSPPGSSNNQWSIPISSVFDGGTGKDGIPSLQNPLITSPLTNNFLDNDDLVIGLKVGNKIRAYPHSILDYHEVINDTIDQNPITVSYCPLTGTGFTWERIINEEITTFGVSGLLYNSNLILYDRATESHWSQILQKSVNGPLIGRNPRNFPIIETKWKTWLEMYPETELISTETGFHFSYDVYQYLDYRTNHDFILFPVDSLVDRLPAKERVHVVIRFDKAFVYRFKSFSNNPTVFHDFIEGEEIILLGSEKRDFMVSYLRRLEDGSRPEFTAYSGELDSLMIDHEGNIWNGFGEAIDGPRKGQKLTPTKSMMSFWFVIGALYPKAIIYE